MADPKYAGLPGIAASEKDVYESGDLPEDDQNWAPDELMSEAVAIEEIDSKKAHDKFNAKFLAGDGADFSGKIGSKPGYDAGEFCIIGPGETETPTQKLQRLKAETTELAGQLKISGEPGVTSAELISQLESLQNNVSAIVLRKGSFGGLMESLQQAVTSDKKVPTTVQVGASVSSGGKDKTNIKVSSIESRIAILEKIVGRSTEALSVLTSETKVRSLREIINDLQMKQNLLEPENISQIDTRLQAVLNKLNDINKAKKQEGVQEVAVDKKILEMYELMQKWDSVCASLPSIINRLESLNELHQQASDFSTTVQHLEQTQQQIEAKLSDTSSLSQQLSSTMKENAVAMQKNIEALDKRINLLTSKK